MKENKCRKTTTWQWKTYVLKLKFQHEDSGILPQHLQDKRYAYTANMQPCDPDLKSVTGKVIMSTEFGEPYWVIVYKVTETFGQKYRHADRQTDRQNCCYGGGQLTPNSLYTDFFASTTDFAGWTQRERQRDGEWICETNEL